jgi:hypothetical protein
MEWRRNPLQSFYDSSFEKLCLRISKIFRKRTAHKWLILALGWVFQVGRKTTAGLIRGAGQLAQKHYASYSRFFNTTSWNPVDFWRRVLAVVQEVVKDDRLIVAVDDTCVTKTGRSIAATGWFVETGGVPTKSTTYVWGQCWVVLSVVTQNPFGYDKTWSFPIGIRLFVPQSECEEGTYQSKLEMAHEMLQRRARWSDRRILALADRLYAGAPFLEGLGSTVDVIVRMKRNAKLFDLPEPNDGVGRPRKKGERLPRPDEWLDQDGWTPVQAHLYGTTEEILIQSRRALWYSVTGTEVGRLCLMKDPQTDQWAVFYSTDPDIDARRIPELYSRRWALEITFRDAKQHGGFKDAQCRTTEAVQRQATFNLGLMSLVQCWFAQQDKTVRNQLKRNEWEDEQAPPSFQIMLQTLRWFLRKKQFSHKWGQTPCSGKMIEEFFDEIARAA